MNEQPAFTAIKTKMKYYYWRAKGEHESPFEEGMIVRALALALALALAMVGRTLIVILDVDIILQ